MVNQTVFTGFQILGFSNNGEKEPLPLHCFFLDLFDCNLAFVDICYLNVTLPKFMDILLSGNNSITFFQCFTCFCYLGWALKIPPHYEQENMFTAQWKYLDIWPCEFFVLYQSGIKTAIFHSNRIKQLFCEIKALAEISCDVTIFSNVIYIDAFLFGLTPFSLNVTSYINIIGNILHVKSTHDRKKAFSTCTSHFTVLIIFYGTVLWLYMRPFSKSKNLDPAFSVLYIGVTPMLNPIIYSLRNKEVKNALLRSVNMKTR
ncbi:hypothetical protein XELAEV_18018838mg [Xenopus laevis]|uniref:G-protein coupled receptors family 1 profile domain-containing protein n=1 Tax=Xenopus laevis TaxID=8355 RepID=A0A974DFL4_XENLA|nr:hypothetical protein XELAEV_18018838mg [Xenopus laevis]